MEKDQLSHMIEAKVASFLQHFNESEVVFFTPSIQAGRRFIGFKIKDQEFAIEINVTEV